jgi:hypothetical protein
VAQAPDGRSLVQAALDAVNRAGMAPVDMRYFAAREGMPADYSRQRVRECEIYVAVIGFRYGSIVPSEAMSYTELEFDEASTVGLPRLVFFLTALLIFQPRWLMRIAARWRVPAAVMRCRAGCPRLHLRCRS